MAAVSWVIWDVLNSALGEDTPAQIISLGTGMAIGGVVYLAVARALRIAEFEQIMRLLLRRRRA
jgi:phosphate starvation-inducible protein PhoH